MLIASLVSRAPAGTSSCFRKSTTTTGFTREFRWPKLARYNIGVDVCDKWAAQDPNRLAILNVRADGKTEDITFGWLRETSNRLANTLAAHGIARGDRVAMLLPQTPEAAAGHIAIYKLGAVAVPLAILFGVDALSYRLAERRREGGHHQRAGAREARPRSAASCRSSRSSSRSTEPATARSACTRRSRARPPTSRRPTRRRTIPR